MRKPRPTPDINLVFHPELDAQYRHFEGHAVAPFNAAATVVTRANAWWLAEAALLTYWAPPDALPRYQSAGLQAVFVESGDTQSYVAWNDSAVLVSFRGTQPGRLQDIVDDALIGFVPAKTGLVHFGFHGALERVWTKLMAVVEPLSATRTVWFGGHSLGAAIAILAADRYPQTAGVSTLGAPRVGEAFFVAAFNKRFGERSRRYVNDTDVVTNVPIFPYAHVGALRHITPDGLVTTQEPPHDDFVQHLFGGMKPLNEMSAALHHNQLKNPPDFMLDHMPRSYTIDIWNDLDAHGLE
jgi:hypothetical protein